MININSQSKRFISLLIGLFVFSSIALAASSPLAKTLFSQLSPSIAIVHDVFDNNPWDTAKLSSNSITSRNMVLLVEDSHTNYSGQMNLVKFLEYLSSRIQLEYVFLEAGSNDVTLNHLRNLGSREGRHQVGMEYLRQGLIHGAEYANLVFDQDFNLWGVENQELYEQSLHIYAKIAFQRKHAIRHLENTAQLVDFLKTTIHSSNRFDRRHEAQIEVLAFKLDKLEMLLKRSMVIQGASLEGIPLGMYYQNKIATPLNQLTSEVSASLQFSTDKAYVFQNIEDLITEYRRLTHLRDQEFIQNMLSKMEMEQMAVGVLVVGKSHIDNLKDILRKRNMSYAVVQPQTTTQTDYALYDRILLKQSLSEAIESANSLISDQEIKIGSSFTNTLMVRPLMTQAQYDVARQRIPLVVQLERDLKKLADNQLQAMPSAEKLLHMSRDAQEKIQSVRQPLTQPIGQGLKTAKRITGMLKDPGSAALDAVANFVFSPQPKSSMNASGQFVSPTGLSDKVVVSTAQTNRHRYEAHNQYVNMVEELNRNREGNQITEAILNSANNQYETMMDSIKKIETRHFPTTMPALPNRLEQYRPTRDPLLVSQFEQRNIERFLKSNISDTGLPLSYKAPVGYWDNVEHDEFDEVNGIIERQIVEYSVNIYDGAVWQIALSLMGKNGENDHLIENFTERLRSNRSGALQSIRASDKPFRYGDDMVELGEKHAYFFRIISDRWLQPDPKTKATRHEDFPNNSVLHHEDWKPITGEQAWAGVIAPLQLAYKKYNGQIPFHSKEMQIAINLLPAFEAMLSPIGAVYHAAYGTHGKHPKDISNENNFSLLAALRMLDQALETQGKEDLQVRVKYLIKRLLSYFRHYGFNYKDGVFDQGGFLINGEFIPTTLFAVDCQTWGIAVLGPEWIDEQFGHGTTYRIWQNTKRRAGMFGMNAEIEGVGFTDGNDIVSVEWTAGAIYAARAIADYYRSTNADWSKEALRDARSMRRGIENYKENSPNGITCYLYASKRFFIPFGWWANPIPSLVSTAWVTLLNNDFNPFILGG